MNREEIVEELEDLSERMYAEYDHSANDAVLFFYQELRELIKEIEA